MPLLADPAVPTASLIGRHATPLFGRGAEVAILDALLGAVRGGEGRALVVYGDAGVGKTALLEYVAGRATASGCRVVGAAGVQSEIELPFAALHQLCAPLLSHRRGIPDRQREALSTTFGLTAGPVPDPLLVGIAVLSLVAEAAAERPLLWVVDDDQWLDRASAQVLAFVARRLGAESVGLVLGGRVPSADLGGLAQLAVQGLAEHEARALLDAVLVGPVDPRVRDEIVAETRGNPLALVELPQGLTQAQLAGGFGLPGALELPSTVEESFRRRADALPPEARRLLLLAAAEPLGDPVLLWRAADRLGIGAVAARTAQDAGLIEFGGRVRFRHPLVRSAAYWSGTAHERQQVHAALAEATDPATDPDRRAWHRAQAAPAQDEVVAAELDRCAGRAQARGGLAAAGAFLERAMLLTPDPRRRARRALAAAQAEAQAGAFGKSLDLLAAAEAGPLDDHDHARTARVRAQLAFATSGGSDAPLLLLKAAKRLEPIDADLARATYLDALAAAMFAGHLASPGGELLAVARWARTAPRPRAPGPSDLLLDGLAAVYDQGCAVGLPVLRRALMAFGGGMPADQEVRRLMLGVAAAFHIWDDNRSLALSDRYVHLVRQFGALGELPVALSVGSVAFLFAGETTVAASLVGDVQASIEATGIHFMPYGPMTVAAWRGNDAELSALIDVTAKEAPSLGAGAALAVAQWANAVLNNGLGRYPEAMAAAKLATENYATPPWSNWALVELVEAAARSGTPATAVAAHRRLAEMTGPSGTDWALGVEARSHALTSDGADAEALYLEAIARLSRTRVRAELARAHLLYGEWLRRGRRRGEARAQLRAAHAMFGGMSMEAFAQRARRELAATGETVRKPGVEKGTQLTAQEAQVAKLARDGLSNPEIGARLFISARTVQYHLSKVFTKLDITSRSQLDRALV